MSAPAQDQAPFHSEKDDETNKKMAFTELVACSAAGMAGSAVALHHSNHANTNGRLEVIFAG